MQRSKTVDDYIRNAPKWRDELTELRRVVCSTSLEEEVKWGGPCYTYNSKNIVGIGGFKSYFGLWFHQGALLRDDAKVLMNAQEGVTKALRQWRMSSAADIKPSVIKRYIKEAVNNVDAGFEIKADRDKPVEIPVELENAMRRKKGATKAFRDLRLGAQRDFARYVAEAKRDETRQKRVQKILPMILAGRGLNDKYRR